MGKATEVVGKEEPSTIEIRNIYFMFLYAWEYFREDVETDVRLSESTNLVDLFAKVLLAGTRRLVRRGLDRGYTDLTEETRSPRGRFLIGDSLKRATWLRGTAICLFDELGPDLLHNQIIKATMRNLIKSAELDEGIAHDLRLLQKYMSGVGDIRLSDSTFSRVKLTRNTRHYGLLVRVCQLLHLHLLVGEGSGKGSFRNFMEDETALHALFEKFVRNFFSREQQKYIVSASQVPWDVYDSLPEHSQFLPTMQTDIVLRSASRTVIIDTKYYSKVLIGRGSHKVQSAHLYQILTYLSQWKKANPAEEQVEGILLYAKTVSEAPRLSFNISGFTIRVLTLDLSQPWERVHSDLLKLVA